MVSVLSDKFESRKVLLILWRGFEKEKFLEESLISGCVFVYMSGFIGVNRSYEGVLVMVKVFLIV